MSPRLIRCVLLGLAVVLPGLSQQRSGEEKEKNIPAADQEVNQEVVATVNGSVITMEELMKEFAPYEKRLKPIYPRKEGIFRPIWAYAKLKTLNNLINKKVILFEFGDRLDDLPDEAVEREVGMVIDRVFKGKEKLFRKHLEENNLTLAQSKEQQRKELLIKVVCAKHRGKVEPPNEEELRRDYYERWKMIHRDRSKDVASYRRIYLRKDEEDEADGKKQLELAQEIFAKIKAGDDFGDLARKYSDDAMFENGGLWKDIPRPDLSLEFGELIFASEGNDPIEPFDDGFGINIIQVIERRFGPAEPFEKARPELTKWAVAQKEKANLEAWMEKTRARYEIKIML